MQPILSKNSEKLQHQALATASTFCPLTTKPHITPFLHIHESCDELVQQFLSFQRRAGSDECLLKDIEQFALKNHVPIHECCLRNIEFINLYQKFSHSPHRKLWQVLPSPESFWNKLNLERRLQIISVELFKHLFKSLLKLEESSWHPRLGAHQLKKMIETKGLHHFLGNFNHSEQVTGLSVLSMKRERNLWVLFVKKLGTATQSDVMKLSYAQFLKQLTDQYGHRYSNKPCQQTQNYGLYHTP